MAEKTILAVGLILVLAEVRDFQETGIKIHQGTWKTLVSVCPEGFHPATYQRQDHRMLVDSVMAENDIGSVWMPYRRVTLSRWVWANGTPAATNDVPESSTDDFGCGYVSFRVAPRDSTECSTPGYGYICQGAGKEICSKPGVGYGDCLNISDRWFVYGCGVNNWFEASFRCQSLGGELASIVSEWIVDRMKKAWFTDQGKPCDSVWIGLNREKWESSSKYDNAYGIGSEISSVHLFWGTGEPNRKHNCSILQRDAAGRLYLRSAECTAQHHILCVRDDAEASVAKTKTGTTAGLCPGCTVWTVVFGVLSIVCLLLLALILYLCRRVRRRKTSEPEKHVEEAERLLDKTPGKTCVTGDRNQGDEELSNDANPAENQTQVVTSPSETQEETNQAADTCLNDVTPSESQDASASCRATLSNKLENSGNSESTVAQVQQDTAAGYPVAPSSQMEPPGSVASHTPQEDKGPSQSLNQHPTHDAQADLGKAPTGEDTQQSTEPLIPVVFSKRHNENKVQIRVYIIDSNQDYRKIIQKIDIQEPWTQQQSDSQILWQDTSQKLEMKLEALHRWKVSPDITETREIGQILRSFNATRPFHLVCSRLLTLDGHPDELDIVFTFSVGGKDQTEVISICLYDQKDTGVSKFGGEGNAAENLIQSKDIKPTIDPLFQPVYRDDAIDLQTSKSGDHGGTQQRSEPVLTGDTGVGVRDGPRADNPENQQFITSDLSTSPAAVGTEKETSDKVAQGVEAAGTQSSTLAVPSSENNPANREATAEEAENKENSNKENSSKESVLGVQNMTGKTE